MKQSNPLPLLPQLLGILLVTLLVSRTGFALSLDEALFLALKGPEAPYTVESNSLDYSYFAEISSRYTTNQKLTSLELKTGGSYKSLSLNSTFNLLNKSLSTHLSMPLSLFKPKMPKAISSDSSASLRGKVVSFFFSLLEANNNLEAKVIACELSKTAYEAAKTDFERGEISFNALDQALSLKQTDEVQLEQLQVTLKDQTDELCYLLSIQDLPNLFYDYSVTFGNINELFLTEKEKAQLDYPLLLAKYELAQARLGLFPQLSLDAVANQSLSDSSTYYGGITFSYVILDSSQKTRVNTLKDKITQVEREREKNLRTLLKQKSRILSDYNNSVTALKSAEAKLLETKEFLSLASQAYREGLINEVDLKKARLTYLQSENSYKAAHHKCTKMMLTISGLIPYQQTNGTSIY